MKHGDISNIVPDSYGWDAELIYKVRYPKLFAFGLKFNLEWLVNYTVDINKTALIEYNKETSAGKLIYLVTDNFTLCRYLTNLNEYQVAFKSDMNMSFLGIKYIYTSNIAWHLQDPYRTRFVEPYKDRFVANKRVKQLLLSNIELLIRKGWVK
jgi:hypothetical protein